MWALAKGGQGQPGRVERPLWVRNGAERVECIGRVLMPVSCDGIAWQLSLWVGAGGEREQASWGARDN